MKVAVTGWYGNDNLGDELLAWTTVDALRGVLPSARITVLTHRRGNSGSLRDCRPLFLRESSALVRASRVARHVVRTRGDWLRLVMGLDLLVVGGGSLFHDRQPENIRTWTETLKLYRRLGSAVALYGVTIDPVRGEARRRQQRELLRLVDVITVRDQASKRWMQELDPSRSITLAADPVLDCALLPVEVPVTTPSPPKRIGFNIRPLSGVPDRELIGQGAQVVMELLRRFDAQVRFIPMWPGDAVLGHAIASSLAAGERFTVLDHQPDRLEAHVAVYKELDVVVAMRLHTVELAVRCGVPVVGLRYDPKVLAFLADVGLGEFCHHVSRADGIGFEGLDGPSVVSSVARLLERWNEIGPTMRSRLEALRHRESNNAASIRDWHDRVYRRQSASSRTTCSEARGLRHG